MSIADELLELQANTTALDTVRTDIRSALVAKGVDASTHNFADFPNDVENISSGIVEARIKFLPVANINVTITADLQEVV